MAQRTFFARIETINPTTYDTNTIRVYAEDSQGYTLRIAKGVSIEQGSVYQFTVKPVVFKDKDQFQVVNQTVIDDLELTMTRRQELMDHFYNYAPINIEDIKTQIEFYLKQITNPTIKAVVDTMYERNKNAFYLYPAATKFHHAYIGGLSYHTATMMRLIDGFLVVYPFLNQDLLIAGIMLHDIMKTKELSDYAHPEYTLEGRLLGHITMAIKEIEVVAHEHNLEDKEEVLLIQHMILSHHYYGNYGSPKKTNIPEALILHFIDNIDSKMTVLQETLDQTAAGEFTSPIGVLDREKYYKAAFDKDPNE